MKLKEFTTENVPHSRYQVTPTVRFNPNSGMMSFTKSAVEVIGCKQGDRISVVQDLDNPKDWYITKNTVGFELRSKTDGTGFLIQNTNVCREMLSSLGITESKKFLLAREATIIEERSYWAIITSSAK